MDYPNGDEWWRDRADIVIIAPDGVRVGGQSVPSEQVLMKLTDLNYRSLLDPYDTAKIASLDTNMLAQFDSLRSPAQEALEHFQRQNDLYRSLYPDRDLIKAAGKATEIWRDHDQLARGLGYGGIADLARRAAETAAGMNMPDALVAYRLSHEDMMLRFMSVGAPYLLEDSATLAFFNNASALAHAYDQFSYASRALAEVTRSFDEMSAFQGSLTDYRNLLDVTGLRLPRWPTVRLLTKAEKRRRLRGRLTLNAEPPQVRRAKSLVHRWERTLRELFDEVMAAAYGEDWPEQRLPACDCKDLLGKWRSRGGAALDHADYVHYAHIVSHPEHFSEIFSRGFEDSDAAGQLFRSAGRLRAASHHGGDFTTDDLKELTLIWRTIEKGLLGLIEDYTMEY